MKNSEEECCSFAPQDPGTAIPRLRLEADTAESLFFKCGLVFLFCLGLAAVLRLYLSQPPPLLAFDLIYGAASGVVFSVLNFRSWKLVVLRFSDARLLANLKPRFGSRWMALGFIIFLKSMAIFALISAWRIFGPRALAAGAGGIILYLFTGSFVLMLSYRRGTRN